jgi:hypothetical protein
MAACCVLLAAALGLAGGCAGPDDTDTAASQDDGQAAQQAAGTDEQPVPSDESTPAAPLTYMREMIEAGYVEDGWLLGIALPIVVSDVVDQLGEPTAVDLPDPEDPSPWGQWFRWDVADGAYTYSALSDSYSSDAPDYAANFNVSVLRLDGTAASPALIDGVSLGRTTREDLEALLGDQLASSNLANRGEFDDTGAYASCLSRKQDDVFVFYLFDDDDVLAGLAQATFDIGNVD